MPKVSFVVPVYCAEEHIERCVYSIINQSYEDFECILIDDGSIDSSGDICDKFSNIDKRILTIHQKNSGASAARNTGIDNATGEYIAFVDSDDFLDSDYLLSLIESHEDSDIVVGGYKVLDSLNVVVDERNIIDTPVELIQSVDEGIFADALSRGLLDTVWGKLIKKELIGNNRFKENIKLGEDTAFLFTVLQPNIKIAFCSECNYNYYEIETALVKNMRFDIPKDFMYFYDKIFIFTQKVGYVGAFIKALSEKISNEMLVSIMYLEKNRNYTIKEQYNYLKVLFSNNYANKCFKLGLKRKNSSIVLKFMSFCSNPFSWFIFINFRRFIKRGVNGCE